MTFTTLTFLAFLAVVFSLYWATPSRRLQNALLLAASYFFYGWWDARFCLLLLSSSVVDFLVGRGLTATTSEVKRRWILAVSVASNLGVLVAFKYFDFFVDNFRLVCEQLGWPVSVPALRWVLPVGLSFYTFQTMSYTFDVYSRKINATRSLLDYLAYVSFFPQLVAGPIERATHLLPQFFERRSFVYEKGVDGCRQILWGFFKKLLIADRLGAFVDEVYGSLGTADGPRVVFATLAFAFQIYCDFSAYSDIAIGTAKLFGFDLNRNFAYPYFSQSVTEFWRRWHMSLAKWLRDYVYIPLGGNRMGRWRTAFNILAVFGLSGLWHGASWNFVVWGLLMGGVVVIEAILQASQTSDPVPGGSSRFPTVVSTLKMAFVFSVVGMGWIFFRAESLGEAVHALETIVASWNPNVWNEYVTVVVSDSGIQKVIWLVTLLLLFEWFQRRHPYPLYFPQLHRWQRWAIYALLLWSILFIGPVTNRSFIYFTF
ncbi:MAG: MBOAT family O-acyltransferase [Gemmataceae bacterium]